MVTQRPAADSAISIGQVFLGKYRVDAVLGSGGMGVVAKCTHLGLNEQVAIKMLRPDVLLDRDAVERFMREAQAASKLKSEHVARVVDVGVFDHTGVPYMVMEFLDGHDLGDLIDQRGTIPAAWACLLVLQAAEALAEAHSIGIVHRDVKPTNLFVTWRPDGTAIVKVLDFGISKAPTGTDMQLTQTQSLLGTPAYMSPEQMRSARLVDARSDIWSLGTVLYELLEGRRPFEAESFSEMCVKVAVDPPAEMIHAPPALRPVVMRCLAKTPEQRFASMAELGRALIPFTQDPHHATMLVDRMHRMLVRPGREFSAPMQAWRGSETSLPKALVFPNTPAHGIPAPLGDATHRERSVPVAMPTEMTRRRRRWPFVLLGATLVAGAALAIGLSSSSEPVAPRLASPESPRPAPIEPVKAAPTEPVVVPTEGSAVAVVPDPQPVEPRPLDKPAKLVGKKPPGKAKPTGKVGTVKQPVVEVKLPPPPAVARPKCNPFDHAHAQDCTKQTP